MFNLLYGFESSLLPRRIRKTWKSLAETIDPKNEFLILTDHDFSIVRTHPRINNLLGFSQTFYEGKKIMDIFQCVTMDNLLKQSQVTGLKGTTTSPVPVALIDYLGRKRFFDTSVHSFGRNSYFLIRVREVTEVAEYIQKLEQRRQSLKEKKVGEGKKPAELYSFLPDSFKDMLDSLKQRNKTKNRYELESLG